MMKPAERLAAVLASARESGVLIDAVPDECAPRTLEDAYGAAALLAQGRGAVAGYKVGATSTRGQAMLGLDEPFFGRVFADTVVSAPARISLTRAPYAVEPEIAFVMSEDVPPRSKPYACAELLDAVGALAPALEINRPSWRRPFEVGGLALIADNGVNVGACLGGERRDWRVFELDKISVSIRVDDGAALDGVSSNVLGNPVAALAWLANALPRWGEHLKRGQFVLSGAMTPPVDVSAGQCARARFAHIATVELTVASEVMPRAIE